jgi:thioredoxin domain-containing protein 5
VNIGKVDCTEHRPICKEFDVKGYPTLLWLENGKKIDKYSGPRSLDDLKAYIERRSSGEKPAEVEKTETKEEGEGTAVLQLSTETFEQGIEKGINFIKFYAP